MTRGFAQAHVNIIPGSHRACLTNAKFRGHGRQVPRRTAKRSFYLPNLRSLPAITRSSVTGQLARRSEISNSLVAKPKSRALITVAYFFSRITSVVKATDPRLSNAIPDSALDARNNPLSLEPQCPPVVAAPWRHVILVTDAAAHGRPCSNLVPSSGTWFFVLTAYP